VCSNLCISCLCKQLIILHKNNYFLNLGNFVIFDEQIVNALKTGNKHNVTFLFIFH